jgi:predicted MFS family arabinose efflux permease
MAIHEMCIAGGIAAGSIGGGFLYQHFRLTGTAIILLLALGIMLAVIISLGKKEVKTT